MFEIIGCFAFLVVFAAIWLAVYKLGGLDWMTDASLSYRAVLYDGRPPGWLQFGYFTAWAIGMFVAGLLVFNRLEAGLAEEL